MRVKGFRYLVFSNDVETQVVLIHAEEIRRCHEIVPSMTPVINNLNTQIIPTLEFVLMWDR